MVFEVREAKECVLFGRLEKSASKDAVHGMCANKIACLCVCVCGVNERVFR